MKKNSKKKVLIAAILSGILLLGAIVSIVLVIAATNQNIASNVKISYSVDGVGAKVSAKYGLVKTTGEVSMTSMTTADGTSTELNFYVSDSNEDKILMPNGEITLTQETGLEVVFEYRFENTADTLFNVGMVSLGESKNITETYYVSADPLAESEYGRIVETLLDGENSGELVIPKQAILSTTDSGNVVYVYIKVAVANPNRTASYEKEYNWELKQLTSAQVPFDLSLNNGDGSGESSVTVVKGAVVPVMASLPSAPAGKGFAGYYDAQTDGNLIVSKNGIGVKEISNETILYARYDEASILDTTGTTLFGFNPTASATTATISTLEVPATITEIAPSAFENNTSIESVTIGGETAQATGYATGSALKKIGAKAFAGCTNLTDINFATNMALKIIGSEAFKGCIKLTELIIPKGVTTIEAGALQNLTELTHLVIPSTVTSLPGINTENAPLKGCDKLVKFEGNINVMPSGAYEMHIGLSGLFNENSASYVPATLKHIVINGGTIIKECNFGALGIESIEISDSITEIKADAFRSCVNLAEITIPNYVTTIGDYAFYGCTGMAELTIGRLVTRIGEEAFKECTGLTVINYNATDCSSMGSWVFERAGQEADGITVNIGKRVKVISNNLFYVTDSIESAPKIKEVVFEENSICETIGESAFFSCYDFESIDLPNTIKTIGNYAFWGTNLKSIIIPEGCETIGSYAFSDCFNLREIEIPKSMTVIDEYAFYNCSKLTELIIPKAVTSIGVGALQNLSSLTRLVLPKTIKSLPGTSTENAPLIGCNKLEILECHADVFSLAGQPINSYQRYCSGLETLYGHSIDDNMDWEGFPPSTIKEIIINGGTKIYQGMFSNTSAISITLPSSITEMGIYAFYGCSRLTEIELPELLTEISTMAFNYCSSLASITIPDSVTSIKDSAFASCGDLNSITIPNSVTSFEWGVFAYCSSLTDIYYKGTQTQWNAILNLNRADIPSSCTIHYDSVETVISSLSQLQNMTAEQKAKVKIMEIASGITSLPENAFYGFTALERLTISDSVTTIGKKALHNLSALKYLRLPSSYSMIPGIHNVDVDERTTDNILLTGCSSLKYLVCSSDIIRGQSGSSDTYSGLDGLYGFVGSGGMWNGSYAPSTLKNISFNGGTTIYSQAFYGENLSSLSIVDSVTNIQSSAFENCTGLTYTTYQNGKYLSCNGNRYYALIEVIDKSLSSFTINSNTKLIAGYVFDGFGGGSYYSIVIPDSVIGISNGAFDSNLSSITLGKSVRIIGDNAFASSAITEIIIPDSVVYIGNYVFNGCWNLLKVNFSNTSGWKIYETSTSITGYEINVSDSSINANRLTTVGSSQISSLSTNWCDWCLRRDA